MGICTSVPANFVSRQARLEVSQVLAIKDSSAFLEQPLLRQTCAHSGIFCAYKVHRSSDNKHDSAKVASQACEHFCGFIEYRDTPIMCCKH
jgi:hypothetical protein